MCPLKDSFEGDTNKDLHLDMNSDMAIPLSWRVLLLVSEETALLSRVYITSPDFRSSHIAD